MKIEKITTALTNVSGRTGLVLRKHSPEILMVTGIIGVVGATVLACRATLKVEEVIAEHEDKIGKTKREKEIADQGEISYPEQDYQKNMTVVYIQTAVEFIKLYGPSITLGIASISCIIGSHGIMKKRNVALMAAYKAVEEGFAAYRKRVVDEYGENKDYIFKNGLSTEISHEKETDEDGKMKRVIKEKLVPDPNGVSVYARFFDDGCTQWSKTPEYNLVFLKAQQNYFNDMLKARGHVFLNEVYDALGIPRSQAGQVVGWVLGQGDDYIDFGIYGEGRARDFVNGYERTILLDFNVDGVIYDLI